MFFESLWLNCLILLGLLVALTFDYVTKFFSYWYVRHVPYKFSIPFFGSDYHRVLGLRNTSEEVNFLYKQNPGKDFVGSVKSRIPDLLVRKPDLIKEVLCTEFESFKSRGLDLDKSRDICIRNNLFYAEGEKWTLLRERLETLLNNLSVHDKYILESLSGTNGNINVQHLLTKVLDNVYKNLFLQDSSDSVIVTKLRTMLLQRSMFDKFFSYIKNIFPSIYIFFGLSTMPRVSKDILEEINHSHFAKTIHSMFDLNNKDVSRNLKSNSEDLTFEIFCSIISEGYVPILNVLNAVLFELAKNLEIQKQARESSDDFINAIIKEAMRLHPPISVITRKCVKTYKFSQSKVLVDKKVTLNIPVEAIHTDETYFKEAGVFKPERFLNDGAMHGYAYLPFGAGPRKCVGEHLSFQILRGITKSLVKRFQIETTDNTPEHLPVTDHNFQRVVDTDLWLKFQPIQKVNN